MTELFAFVILPSRPEFIEFYQDVILPVLNSAGYEVQRSENVFDLQNSLKDQILNIHRANLIVADLTMPSAHVLYELGIAQGLLKPTVLITQRIERMPFDLRSYRVLEYGLHYKRIDEFRNRLRELAETHKTGLIDYGNPVMDYIPSLVTKLQMERLLPDESEQAQDTTPLATQQVAAVPVDAASAEGTSPAAAAQAGAAVTESTPPNSTPSAAAPPTPAAPRPAASTSSTVSRPQIREFAVEAVQAMDKINSGVRRIAETTTTFTLRLNDQNTNIKTIRARGVNGDPKELREALNAAADDMEAYTNRTEGEAPYLRTAWERLLKSTTDLIAVVSIESSEDREAANLFAAQMQSLQTTVNGCVTELNKLKETIGRTPNISKNLNRAIIRGEQSVNAIAAELTTGQSYIQRTLNLLRERLNAPTRTAEPSSKQP